MTSVSELETVPFEKSDTKTVLNKNDAKEDSKSESKTKDVSPSVPEVTSTSDKEMLDETAISSRSQDESVLSPTPLAGPKKKMMGPKSKLSTPKAKVPDPASPKGEENEESVAACDTSLVTSTTDSPPGLATSKPDENGSTSSSPEPGSEIKKKKLGPKSKKSLPEKDESTAKENATHELNSISNGVNGIIQSDPPNEEEKPQTDIPASKKTETEKSKSRPQESKNGEKQQADSDNATNPHSESTSNTPKSSKAGPASKTKPGPASRTPKPGPASKTPKHESDDSQANASSEESKDKVSSDESKAKTSSDESKDKTSPDESKDKVSSDESKAKTSSDESKDKTSPDESKDKVSSDESQAKTSSDESKDKTSSDESKAKTSSDESKAKISSDESKAKISSEESKSESSSKAKPGPASKTSKPGPASKLAKPGPASKTSKPGPASQASKSETLNEFSDGESASKTSKSDASSKLDKTGEDSKPGPASKTSKPGPASKTSKPGPASKTSKPGPASKTSKPGPASKKAESSATTASTEKTKPGPKSKTAKSDSPSKSDSSPHVKAKPGPKSMKPESERSNSPEKSKKRKRSPDKRKDGLSKTKKSKTYVSPEFIGEDDQPIESSELPELSEQPAKKKKKRRPLDLSRVEFVPRADGDYPSLRPESTEFEKTYELPDGWIKKTIQRQGGSSVGLWDAYLFPPPQYRYKRLRSGLELVKFMIAHPDCPVDVSCVNMEKDPDRIMNADIKPSVATLKLKEFHERISNGESVDIDDYENSVVKGAAKRKMNKSLADDDTGEKKKKKTKQPISDPFIDDSIVERQLSKKDKSSKDKHNKDKHKQRDKIKIKPEKTPISSLDMDMELQPFDFNSELKLEKYLYENPSRPSKDQMKVLAKETDLNYRAVKKWFKIKYEAKKVFDASKKKPKPKSDEDEDDIFEELETSQAALNAHLFDDDVNSVDPLGTDQAIALENEQGMVDEPVTITPDVDDDNIELMINDEDLL